MLSGGFAQGFEVVTRFNADGTPDTTFGVNGQAQLANADGAFVDLTVMTDGDIVAVGSVGSPTTGIVARLTALGQPDTGFDGNGYLQLAAGDNKFMQLTAAFEQSGGDLIVVGMRGGLEFSSNLGVFATRLDEHGATDTTYGTNGEAFSDDITPSGVCGFSAGTPVAQPDGSSLIIATEACGIGATALVYGLTAGGTVTNLNPELISHIGGGINGVAPLPGGGVLATASQIMGPNGPERSIFSVTAAGTLVPPVSEDSTLFFTGLVAMPDGRFAMGLTDWEGGATGGVQVRNAAGQLDTTFGGDGTIDGAPVAGVAAAPDSKVLALGGVDTVEVRRYLTAGVPGVAPPKLTPVTPARILDTRAPGVNYTGPKPGADQTITVQVAGRGGVPTTGATAVVLNVTATQADGPGFVTDDRRARRGRAGEEGTRTGDTQDGTGLGQPSMSGAQGNGTQAGGHRHREALGQGAEKIGHDLVMPRRRTLCVATPAHPPRSP